MDIKYKNENDPTWEKTTPGQDDDLNENSTKRPRSLEEIQQGVYLEQQRERERIRRQKEAEEALEHARLEKERKAEEERLAKERLEQEQNAIDETYSDVDNQDINEDYQEVTDDELVEEQLPGFKGFIQKIKVFSKKTLKWMKKHKVITSIIAVLLALIIAATAVINHFLNKINYVDDNGNSSNSEEVKFVNLSTGEIIDVSKLTKNADGTYTLPDGRRFNTDRTVWNTNGSVVFYDGSYILADGTAVLTDGTTFYPNGSLVFQDGSYYSNTEITSDREGYLHFPNGVTAHTTGFSCAKSGLCTPKNSLLKNLKHNPTQEWNALDKTPIGQKVEPDKTAEEIEDDEFEKALANSRNQLADSDADIARNYNNNEIWYNPDIQNILIMGIDYGNKNYPYGRSDAMIILSVNKKTHAVKMISLSRAAYVGIAGYENTRLNHAHGLGGAALAVDTIERNYKVRIDNFVETGFDTFKQIVNVMDGVSIKLSSAEAKALKSKITKAGLTYKGEGTYNLNGDLALEYVRLRKIDSDRERTGRQRKVLLSIASKVKTLNLIQLTNLANKILPLITTNLTKSEILGQLTNVGTYLNGEVKQYVVPKGGYPLTLVDDFEVLKLDWASEVKYIHQIMYGDVVPSYYKK